nr:hypothetical protein [Legionella tunisiensis]
MAEKDVLSQEEIDALLNSVDSEENSSGGDGANAAAATTDEGGMPNESLSRPTEHVQVLNFANQERIVRGELPVLDKIHDRAARFLRMIFIN